MVLTPAGTGLGFSLSTFASGFSSPGGSSCCGPLGMTVLPNGNVLVDSSNNTTNYVFSDVNGQTPGTALSSTPFPNFPPAFATSNGWAWGSHGFSGGGTGLIRLNNDGTVAATFSTIPVTLGLWTNPVNGHLLGAGSSGIVDIDVSNPLAPTFHIVTSAGSDGVTVSPDGTIVYTSAVSGYRISDGALVFGPFSVAGSDGMGVITSGNPLLNGQIVVNSNFGNIVLLDHITGMQTIIASGGTRGDFTTADSSDGSLLLTQTSAILRLTCAGCAIGAPPSGVPEPESFLMFGAGLIGLLRWLRVGNKRSKTAVI
jgi:hypothetical protein